MLGNRSRRLVSATACALFVSGAAFLGSSRSAAIPPQPASDHPADHWIGTWATAAQPAVPSRVPTFRNQTLRLIVHISAGGPKVRIRLSNTFGTQPLLVGAAHIARRTSEADIDPSSGRALTFGSRPSVTISPGGAVTSDPADLPVAALSDLAISLFFPEPAPATTSHILALQTSYLSADNSGDLSSSAKFPVAKNISSWPFLTGVDVSAPQPSVAIVALGSSTTDGDGSADNANHRWPDVLAERLLKQSGSTRTFGVLNVGIIGNRLLSDSHSPRQTGGPFSSVLARYGDALGPSGLSRFQRDVLDQSGVGYVVLALGVNDMLFPGSFIPATETISARDLIAANRQLISSAHQKGIKVIATTIPPFENAVFENPVIHFFTPEKEAVRQQLNSWIRSTKEVDGVIDFDQVLRDPAHLSQLLPAYDSGDHLHCNDAGYIASANSIPLSLFN